MRHNEAVTQSVPLRTLLLVLALAVLATGAALCTPVDPSDGPGAPPTPPVRSWRGLALPPDTEFELDGGVFTMRTPLPKALRIWRIVLTVWATPILLAFGVGGFPVGLIFAVPLAALAAVPWIVRDRCTVRLYLRRRWSVVWTPVSVVARKLPPGPVVHVASRRVEGGCVAVLQVFGSEVARTPRHRDRPTARGALLPRANELREAMGDSRLRS